MSDHYLSEGGVTVLIVVTLAVTWGIVVIYDMYFKKKKE